MLEEIIYTSRFKKDVKKIQNDKKKIVKLKYVIDCLYQEIELDIKYRNHNLIGNYKGYKECHVQPDLLLIYKVVANKLQLVRLGSHSELFN